MLYFDKIVVSEGTDINKASASEECDICHYGYFIGTWFKFQRYICNGCYNVLMISIDLSDIAILNVNDANYRSIINGIRKCDALNLF